MRLLLDTHAFLWYLMADPQLSNTARALMADVRNVLFLSPDRPLGRECLSSAGDAVAFARGAKERMRAFAREHGARRLLLFYFGPLSGACFLGHQMNAIAPEIQVMEDQQPGYAPSFLLA